MFLVIYYLTDDLRATRVFGFLSHIFRPFAKLFLQTTYMKVRENLIHKKSMVGTYPKI